MSDPPVKIGIVGCGKISAAYLSIVPQFDVIEVAACADLLVERAQERAAEFGVPKACSVDELLADPEIQIVVNLTIPQAHAEVGVAAIEAGKSVYNEKPLAVSCEDGRQMVDLAAAKGVLLGGAPDTFLGGGHQTCRKLIEDGWIGQPVGAVAFMLGRGHESWHPDPAFFYHKGGGPMFDMGPYYLTGLVNLLGPVKSVSGITSTSFSERTISSGPKSGKSIEVEVPTHVTGLLEFVNGATGTIITSFDVWSSDLPRIEIYGTEGTLSVPDPNKFAGPVRIKRGREETWKDVPLTHPEGARGIGVSEMASSIKFDRTSRLDAELGFHILDVMQSIHESSSSGHHVTIESGCTQPAAVPTGLLEGVFET